MAEKTSFGIENYNEYWRARKENSKTHKTEIHKRIVEIVKKFTKLDSIILDLGVGPGHVFSELSKSYKCYGVEIAQEIINSYDFSTENIALADFSKGIPNFSGLKFDVVIASMVVHHMDDPGKLIVDIKNNLSENGIALVVSPNIAYYPYRLKYFFFAKFPKISKAHKNFMNMKEIKILIEKSGLNIKTTETVGKLGFIRKMWPSLLSGALFFICTKK
ncbi:MAG: class I SAM-dependent methyltransferase [Patescibacteria group bacterium]